MNQLTKTLIILFALLPFVMNSQNSTKGNWGSVVNSNVNATAAANLPDGRILTWAAARKEDFRGSNSTETYTAIYNPATNSFSDELVNETRHDMFCPGTANLPDGRIMIAGGRTTTRTTMYNPSTNTYETDDEMNTPRGYQTNLTLNDGRVFTIGGSWSGGRGNKNAEVWSQETGWVPYPGITANNSIRQGAPDPEGVYRDDNHAWLFTAPGGRIFQAGPGTDMHWFDLNGVGSVTNAGKRANDPYSMNGNAVMYDIGKILTIGGAPSYSRNDFATKNTHVIDINHNNVSVRKVGDLHRSRVFHNSVVLPNGEVVTIGGMERSKTFSDERARLTAEIWNPRTQRWTEGAAMSVPRTYHSSAILMQDGRVWTGGGGLCGNCPVNHTDMQIYTPPYLYQSNNRLATRPVITSAPSSAGYNGTITVNSNTSISSFSLVRLSSVTHSVNVEQRRIPIGHSSSSNTNHQVRIPGRDLLPPGNYFLFAMNSAGVPSVAKTIKIGSALPITTVPNGDYYISSTENGQYIAAPSFDSRNVRMLNASTNRDRQWRIRTIAPGVYSIQNIASGEFMEVPHAGCARGVNVATFNQVVGDHQKWTITKVGNDYFFRPLHCANFGIDKGNGRDGNTVIWNFSVGNNNQKFRLIRTSSSTPPPSGGGQIVHIRKRNASGFAIDGGATTSDGSNIHLWAQNRNNRNQQWVEINRGNGFFSYQKANTNHCIDGGNAGGNGQNVHLWSCNANNQNQHWRKVNVGGGSVRLVKRNASAFAINGGGGGASGQNVNLHSSTTSQNLHWLIQPVSGANNLTASNSSSESFIFNATPNDKRQAELHWTFDQTKEIDQYVVQYAEEMDYEFTDLDVVDAASTLNIQSYEYIHDAPLVGSNFYQVKVMYTDGNVEYLPLRNVALNEISAPIKVFPNPTADQLFLDLSNYMDEKVNYFVTSQIGQVVLSGEFNPNHSDKETLDLSKYANGNYFIRLRPENNVEITQQFVIAKN